MNIKLEILEKIQACETALQKDGSLESLAPSIVQEVQEEGFSCLSLSEVSSALCAVMREYVLNPPPPDSYDRCGLLISLDCFSDHADTKDVLDYFGSETEKNVKSLGKKLDKINKEYCESIHPEILAVVPDWLDYLSTIDGFCLDHDYMLYLSTQWRRVLSKQK